MRSLAALLVIVLSLPLAAPAFAEPEIWVGPVYFSWFRVNRHGSVMGQYYGPWVPLEGRRAWDGSVAHHKRHLAHIAKARFNMIFAVDTWEYRREQSNLFAAIREREATGRKVPRVAPYFAAGSFECRECPLDFATVEARRDFYRVVKQWFLRFFEHRDAGDLVWIDGKVLIGLWWVAGAETARPAFFTEMNRRLARDFGFQATWSANYTWQQAEPDEINYLFGSLSALESNPQGNVDLLVGFWPPEGQARDAFLARDGGVTYATAWDQVLGGITACAEGADLPRRISVVSYNELTEGSGIYPAVCSNHNTARDRHWSGRPSRERCVDAPCHPYRKQDRWAPDCSARRAPFLYLDISKRKIRQLEKKLRRGSADCRRGDD